MAGELLNMGFVWAAALVAAVGVLTTMVVTEATDDGGTSSGVIAIAVALFAIALAASLTL